MNTPELTREEIVDMLGDLDDLTIARLLAAASTRAELLQVRDWLHGNGDDEVGSLNPVLVDLLQSADDEDARETSQE